MNMFPVLEKSVTKVIILWVLALPIWHTGHIRNEDGSPKIRTDIRLTCSVVASLLPVVYSVWPVQPDNAGLGMVFPVVYVWYVSDWLVLLLVVKDCF